MYETLISIAQASALIAETTADVVAVDCRYMLADAKWGRSEYLKSHLPGAVFADLNIDLSGPITPGVTGRHPLPDPEKFVGWIQDSGIGSNTQIIAYDQAGGGIAARLWWLMRWIGHDAVAVLDGGWAAWLRAGLTTDTAPVIPKQADYKPSRRDLMQVDVNVILNLSQQSTHTLVDSREERRYAGIEEPIDPVAGHIPGAINMPFADNLDAQSHWKEISELQDRFRQLTENPAHLDVIFYCGSGVTACHNILAFKHAGMGEAKLYPGSWSEWITDPSRAVKLP
jgi:thiosulfate/3-mercaptopyruvate sulfurtransferase